MMLLNEPATYAAAIESRIPPTVATRPIRR